MKKNDIWGTFGAIIGAILGSFVWGVLECVMISYDVKIKMSLAVCMLCAIVTSFSVYMGYKIMARVITKAGLKICKIVNLVSVFFAEISSVAFYIWIPWGAAKGIIGCYLLIPEYLRTVPDLAIKFIFELVVGYAFSFCLIEKNEKKSIQDMLIRERFIENHKKNMV